MDESMRELIADIEKLIKRGELDLTKRTPGKFITRVRSKRGEPRTKIHQAINTIKRRNKVKIQKKRTFKRSKKNELLEACKKNEWWRASKAQGPPCKLIEQFIINKLPQLGHGLIIGTGLPFFASNHPKAKETIFDDEFALATILRATSESMTVVVGNGVNSEKAHTKVDTLSRLQTFKDVYLATDIVYRDSYSRWITRRIEKYGICKVILLTSGHWEGSKDSYDKLGFDVNFQSPSKYLTSQYINLHILALRMVGTYKFDVMYVHDGVEKVLARARE